MINPSASMLVIGDEILSGRTEDKNLADKIVTGQTEIFSIFKKQSYDNLKSALESWLNPEENDLEGQSDLPWETKAKTTSTNTATETTSEKKTDKATKTDDISAAFDDLFN